MKKQSRGRPPIKKELRDGPSLSVPELSIQKPTQHPNFRFSNNPDLAPSLSSSNPVNSSSDHRLWHLRLGHASASTFAKLPWLSSTYDTDDCESCIFAKAHKTPFNSVTRRASAKLELVHSDLCGPLPASLGGFLYFITFTDDLTRFSWVYPIVDKKSSTIQKVFDTWIRDAENKAGSKVKYFRTDGGGEYEKELKEHLRSLGITHETTAPYSPQQNGVSERLNRTLNEMVRAMLLEANMPDRFWPDAILFAADIKNILPHSSIQNTTPYGLFLGEFPRYDILRPFGCIVYPTIPKERMPKASKYRPLAYKGALISNISSGSWRFWDFKRGQYDTGTALAGSTGPNVDWL
jgi:transposase InsO family protein